MKRKLVAIVGGSGAGKSYLASRIASRLGFGESIIIRLDDFYRDLSLMPLWERDVVNFDEPDAIDWEEFLSALDRIINQDEPAQLPIYDYKTHSRLPLRRVFEPKQLTIIEGLWLIHRSDLRGLFCYSVYVDCPEGLRLQRRIERDARERGRSEESVVRQFRQTVSPMHNRYVEPQRAFADVVIKSPFAEEEIEKIVQTIKDFVVDDDNGER